MAADPEDWLDHIGEALEYLPTKRKEMTRYERYHEGKHPKVWLTKRLRKQFRGMEDHMIDNLCGPAIEKPLSRLRVDSFGAEDTGITDQTAEDGVDENEEAANLLFDESGAKMAQVDAMRDALRFGEGFLYDSEDDEGNKTTTHVDARFVYWPCGQDPRNPDYAVLMLPDYEEGYWRATVLYATTAVQAKGPKLDDRYTFPNKKDSFTEDEEKDHGYDKVPLTRFTDRPFSDPFSRLVNLIPHQDRLNKYTANKMVVGEGLAYPQRVLFTEQDVDPAVMAPRPDSTITLHPGNTTDGGVASSISQFAPADLSNFSDAIMEERKAFYQAASLPMHGLNGDSNASGAAREADEGDFIEYLYGVQDFLNNAWDYWLDLHGLQATTQWRDVRPRGDAIRVENVKAAVEAGVSLRSALVEYGGWSQEQVDRMYAEPPTKAEEMAQTVSLAQARALGGLTDGGADAGRGQVPTGSGQGSSSAPKPRG